MSETTPLIKAALNLRVGVGFDVYDYVRFETSRRIYNISFTEDPYPVAEQSA